MSCLERFRVQMCIRDSARSVIAPGGSCVCREASIAHMRQLGTVVYLELSLPEVERRIHNLATRGIALSPGQTIADVYAYRAPLYERCAHLTVPAGGQSLSETVEAVSYTHLSAARRACSLWSLCSSFFRRLEKRSSSLYIQPQYFCI